jgi:Pectate lyase superfamily protein
VNRFALLAILSTLSAWGQAVIIGPSIQTPPYSNNYLYFNKMHWAGNWAGNLPYNSQDVVNFGGAGYVSLSPLNFGHTPSTSPTWWTLLPGPPGPVGPAGPAVELLSSTYNFPPQTFTTPITGGVLATVALTPCPFGLNAATDVSHYLDLSVVGTPEAVPVTGGTCTSGLGTGTVKFTPTYGHGGGWALGSSTAGMQEAMNVETPGGGVVMVPPGIAAIQSHPIVPSNVTLRGSGQGATTIQVSGSYSGLAWVVPSNISGGVALFPYTAVIAFATACVDCRVESLTVDMNLQTYSSIATNGSGVNVNWNAQQQGGVAGGSMVNPVVDSVSVINWPATDGVPFSFFGASKNGLITRSKSMGSANCIVTPSVTGPGGFFVQGGPHRIEFCYTKNSCDEAFVSNSAHDVIFTHNIYDAGTAIMPVGGGIGAFHCENSTHCTVEANTVLGNYAGGSTAAPGYAVLAAPAGGTGGSDTTDVSIRGNHISNASTAITVGNNFDPTTTARRVVSSDNVITGSARFGIFLQGQIAGFESHDDSIYGSTLAGISTFSNGNGGGSFTNVRIHDDTIDHNGTAGVHGIGIQINANNTCSVEGLQIKNNFIGDSSSSPVQDYGIFRVSGAQFLCQHGDVKDNTLTGNALSGIIGGSGHFGFAFTGADWLHGTLGPNYDGISDTNIAADSTAQDSSTFTTAGVKFYVAHTEIFSGQLVSGSLAFTFTNGFSNINSYVCGGNDDSGAAFAVSVSRTDGTHITVVGTGTHFVSGSCHGN